MEVIYDKKYFDKQKYNRQQRVQLTIATLLKILKYINIYKEKALVIGCAFGYEVEGLYKFGFREVWGVDISPYAIEKAREFYPQWRNKFLIADIQELPFEDNTFHFIFAADVLEHVPNPIKALKEIYRVLNHKGAVYIRVPNTFTIQLYYYFPFKKIWGFIFGSYYECPDNTHISELPQYRWESLFREIGFNFRKLKIESIYLRGSKRLFGKELFIQKPFIFQYNLHYLLTKK